MGVKRLEEMTPADWERVRREQALVADAADDGAAVERGRYDSSAARFAEARTGRCEHAGADNALCWNEATKVHRRALGVAFVCEEHYALLNPGRVSG